MRLKSTLSLASLTTTAALGAAFGALTIAWSSTPQAAPPASLPVMTEEVTVTAPADVEPGLVMDVHPDREAYLAGEEIRLHATLTNVSDAPLTLSSAGTYDLTVQRVRSDAPMGADDVTFLALAQAADGTMVLEPGASVERTVTAGADAPFDRPGRYVVSGSWLGTSSPAVVPAFGVVIEGSESIAAKAVRRSTGA
jgi:hypothetical protein